MLKLHTCLHKYTTKYMNTQPRTWIHNCFSDSRRNYLHRTKANYESSNITQAIFLSRRDCHHKKEWSFTGRCKSIFHHTVRNRGIASI